VTLFRLDASMRSEGSVSRRVADAVEAAWASERPEEAVVRRDLGLDPAPGHLWPMAVGAGFTPEPGRTPEQLEALAASAGLVVELVAADAYLFAVPLYNFGVPHTLKAWLDLVVTDPRMASGAPKILAGRPAVLAAVRGGGYGPGTPREGWDHGTPWVRRILADVFGLDLQVVEAELTLADVNPALAELRPLAAASLAAALERAGQLGRDLADPARRPSAA